MSSWPLLVSLFPLVAVGDDVARKDLQALQGLWKVTELTEKGHRLPAKDTDPIEIAIVGTKMTIRDDGAAREEITLKLEANKTLRAVDFTYTKGPNTGNVERGTYSIEGNTLKFCINEAKDGPRPAEFASTRRNGYYCVVLSRSK